MADLSITAANVVAGTGATFKDGTAGATILAGQPCYLDSATTTYKLGICNALAASDVIGIAMHNALTGHPLRMQTGGEITIGATVEIGRVYVLSVNAGMIGVAADLSAGEFPFVIGIGKTAAIITLVMRGTGVAYV